VAAPILARHAESILNNTHGKLISFFQKRSDNISAMDASARVSMGCLFYWLWLLLRAQIAYSFDAKIKPVAAGEFLKRVYSGNMFNEYEFGDYIYDAYRQYKVLSMEERICMELR
jgi:hypothetical protein